METKRFMTGLGIGMAAGATLSMVVMPRARRNEGRKMVSRALKNMGDVIDDVSAVFGR
ncbi:MAG: hypothetical protein IJT62_07765 [Oscillospiraceae bacterium]|nr:hypothetical protein [Oscillospiraceae bacterium]